MKKNELSYLEIKTENPRRNGKQIRCKNKTSNLSKIENVIKGSFISLKKAKFAEGSYI